MVEEVLKLLIGQIYAELFKTILCKVFKPKNIQDTWKNENEQKSLQISPHSWISHHAPVMAREPLAKQLVTPLP